MVKMVYPSIVIRASLLYEFKNQLTAAEAARKIRIAFGNDAVTDETAIFWFDRFKSGNENVKEDPRVGRCSDDQLRRYVLDNPHSTPTEIALALNSDETDIRKRLKYLILLK